MKGPAKGNDKYPKKDEKFNGGNSQGFQPNGQAAKAKSEGFTAGLDVFDYNSIRMDARAFSSAHRKLVDNSRVE